MDTINAFCLMVALHTATLEPVVKNLGHSNWRVRMKAQETLKQQLEVPHEEFLVYSLRRNRYDIEIVARIDRMVNRWDVLQTEHGCLPCICALPNNFPNREIIIEEYLEKSMQKYGLCLGHENSRCATYLFLRDLRSRGWNASLLLTLQTEMVANERFWYDNFRYPHEPCLSDHALKIKRKRVTSTIF